MMVMMRGFLGGSKTGLSAEIVEKRRKNGENRDKKTDSSIHNNNGPNGDLQ